MGVIDFEARLNPEQWAAVQHGVGPLLILAGAGSGKTRVITHRIAHLILERGAEPSSILAVTFTNKAAAEMRERVWSLLGEARLSLEEERGPWVGTFHRTCARLLRWYGHEVGIPPKFVIYDDGDQRTALRRVMAAMDVEVTPALVHQAEAFIDHAKNQAMTPTEAMQRAVGAEAELLAEVYQQYQAELFKAGCLDFGDLMLQTVELLRHKPAVRRQLQRRWRFLMVDEFQDTNPVQYELLKLLMGDERSLAVVGDDDQAIYGWRGATVRNILDFQKDFPEAAIVKLEHNYRSTQTVLDASSSVIRKVSERMDKTLWTDEGAGEPITVFTGSHEREEAWWVVRSLERLIHAEGFDSRQCAVFYRTNAQARVLEEQFRAAGLGYQMVGGTGFYDRAEVKDVVSYLKVALNTADSVNLLRVLNTPPRGVGKKAVEVLEGLIDGEVIETLWEAITLAVRSGMLQGVQRSGIIHFHTVVEELRAGLAAGTSPTELTEALLEKIDYMGHLERSDPATAEERKESVHELMEALAEYEAENPGAALGDFLERITLQQQADQVTEEGEGATTQAGTVAMMTVHCSKGLEFDAVFVTGLEDRLFPLIPAPEVSDAHLDEERRLGYVALTRARKRLFLTNARRRRLYGGEPRETRPSRFLADIPPGLLRVSSDSVERTVLWRDPLPQPAEGSRWSADELAQVAPLVKLPPKAVPSVSSSGLAARPKSAEDLRKLLDAKRAAERAAQGAVQEEGEGWSVRAEPASEPVFEEPQVVYDDEFAQEQGAGRLAKSGRGASKLHPRGPREEDEYSQAPPSSGEQARRTAPVKKKGHAAALPEDPGGGGEEVEQAPSGGLAFHAKEGPGEILATYGSGEKATVLVRFARTGREMTVLRRYLKIIE